MKTLSQLIKACIPVVLLSCVAATAIVPNSAEATDIVFANEPMAIKTAGVDPNILFLLDDSGSMAYEDVFYAPNYDADNVYRCDTGSILDADTSKVVTILVSLRSGNVGAPYFTYGTDTYGWGNSGDATAASGKATAPRLCFDPNSTYKARFRDYNNVSAGCPANYTKVVNAAGEGNCWYSANIIDPVKSTACPTGFTEYNKICWMDSKTKDPEVSKACPTGYRVNTAGTLCWKTSDDVAFTLSKACPTGYSEDGTRCWNNSFTQPPGLTTACPAGYTLDGSKCYATVINATGTDSCDAGYTLSGGKCWKDSTMADLTATACPGGSTLASGKCWTNTDLVAPICSIGSSLGLRVKSPFTYSCWSNTSGTVKSGPKCDNGYTLVKVAGVNKCAKNTSESTPICVAGKTYLSGLVPQQCGLATVPGTTNTCSSGTLLAITPAKCGIDQVTPTTTYTCPAGYDKFATSKCGLQSTSIASITPGQKICPNTTDWTMWGASPNQQCSLTAQQIPAEEADVKLCPINYTLYQYVIGETCGKNASNQAAAIPNIKSCLAGYNMIFDSPGEKCSQVVSSQPAVEPDVLSCLSGYTLIDKSPTEKKCGKNDPLLYSYYDSWGNLQWDRLKSDDGGVIAYIDGQQLTPSNTVTEVTGNFLNWYLSSTPSVMSSNVLLPAYPTYNKTSPWAPTTAPVNDNPAGAPWRQSPAISTMQAFNTTGTNAYVNDFDPKGSSNFTWFKLGMKTNVSFYWNRMAVAKDVSKILTRKIQGVNMAVGSFHTKADATRDSNQNGFLMHGFVPFKTNDVTTTTDTNKTSVISVLSKLSAGGGTPTAESMVRMARYIYQNWESTEFNYFNDTARTPVSKKISDVLTLDKNTTSAVAYKSTDKMLAADLWCQKSAIAVLTDGQPSGDEGYGGSNRAGLLWSYNAVGTTEEANSFYMKPETIIPSIGWDPGWYGWSGIMRVPGALFDHDFFKDIRGVQNIESFFIAFGGETILNASIFNEAGKAGGGGTDNSFLGTDGAAILAAFKKIVANVKSASTSITAVAVSSVAELNTENYAFQATYDTKFWTSQIKALNVNSDGLFVQPNGTSPSKVSTGIEPEWLANNVMSSMYILNDNSIAGVDVSTKYRPLGVKNRTVYTWNGSDGVRFGSSTMTRPGSSSSTLAEFTALPVNIKNDLAVVAGTNGQEQYDLMMYLLGETKNEANYPSTTTTSNKYRQRGTYVDADGDGLLDSVYEGGLLGDIVSSSPVYVQVPSRPWDDVNFSTATTKYSDFVATQHHRPAMVYAGGNDGMLHGFTVESGTKNGISYPPGGELIAYMPSVLASTAVNGGYHYLSNKSYIHRYYVDGTVTPSDVFMDFYSSAPSYKAEWRTVLVGGLRAGGRGYYALDITCPFEDANSYPTANGLEFKQNTCKDESFGPENVLWEFDSSDDSDLGFSYADPIIARVNYDSGFNYSAGNERNGNGLGRWAAIISNGYNSTDGRAALLIVFLDGGLDGVWTQGVDYVKVYASDSSKDTVTSKNGLSSPTAMDINHDGIVDRVYAGDIKGQMWSFDVSAPASATNWASKPWKANLLLTTRDDVGNPQSITTAPMVGKDMSKSRTLPVGGADLMVIFGTGQYLTDQDLTSKALQTVYAVHDRGDYNLTPNKSVGAGLIALEPRVFKEVTVNTNLNRIITGNALNPAQYGWYVHLASDLNNNGAIDTVEKLGERLVFRSFAAGDIYVFNTITPIVGSCTGATQGWTLSLDWTEGTAYKDATYDANLNGYIDPTDQGYVGAFNASAGSELGRGGNNIYDSVGDIARSQSFNFGAADISERIGWEEKMPFGIKAK